MRGLTYSLFGTWSLRTPNSALELRVERRLVEEHVAVEPNAVLQLEVGALPPRIAERQSGDDLSGLALAASQLARVLRGPAGGEVGERVERERAEQIVGLVLRHAVVSQVARELQSMLVVAC